MSESTVAETYPILSSTQASHRGKTFNLLEVYERFSTHEYGVHLALQTPRFYPSYPVGDEKTHLELLGDDVHRVKHMAYTAAQIAIPASIGFKNAKKPQRLTSDEQAILQLSAIVHDTDEVQHPKAEQALGFELVGDRQYTSVTDADEQKKAITRSEHLYPLFYSDFGDELLDRIEATITHTDEKLGRLFRVVERIGYLTTALRAGILAHEYVLNPNSNGLNSDMASTLVRMHCDGRDRHDDIDKKIIESNEFLSPMYYKMLGQFSFLDYRLTSLGVV